MTTFGQLRWGHEGDGNEGRVKLNAEFDRADHVIQLDALRDWIAALTEEYEARLSCRFRRQSHDQAGDH